MMLGVRKVDNMLQIYSAFYMIYAELVSLGYDQSIYYHYIGNQYSINTHSCAL